MDKHEFKLSELKDLFERGNFDIPNNNEEFKEIFISQSRFPARVIMDKLEKIGMNKDDITDYYSDKEQKIDLFFEKFNVVYDLNSENTENTTNDISADNEQPKIDNSNDTVNTSESSMFEKHIFTIAESKEIFEKIKKFLIQSDKIATSEGRFIQNSNVTIHNEFLVNHKGIDICNNFALITDIENNEVCAVGCIISEEVNGHKKDYFTANKRNINFDKFIGKTRFNIILIDNCHNDIFKSYSDSNLSNEILDLKCYFAEVKIKTEKAKYSENELCIDFGTSNTTVGTYDTSGDALNALEPKIVKFMNVNDNNKLVEICPTVVYVKNCADKDAIEYLFGYEALNAVIKNDYDTKASVFYEIKKWLNANDKDDIITIEDENGNEIDEFSKQKIVKAYLDFIIEQAEEYFGYKFKKLHFSAPIKMKSKFINALTKMYKNTDYEICSEDESIDEALSIVYDHIYENEICNEDVLPCKDKENDKKKKQIVVLDCGGGTTDLATCSYECSEHDGIKHIDIDTQFENGNTAFGGNRITFKIMQLLKIQIALANNKIDKEKYDEIFSKSEEDILSSVDEIQSRKGTSNKMDFENIEVYQQFNELYQECEHYIPTIFTDNKDFPTTRDRSYIKRNFYYLWQFAEKIKLAFYQFGNVMVNGSKLNEDIDISKIEKKEYLYYYCEENEELAKLENPFDKIKISINDIRKIICGDIYTLLDRILPTDCENYDFYKLSGQSCKINLFNELLKEFIPGKKIREKICNKAKESNEELKLKCIKGSIHYKSSTKHGSCEISSETKLPKIIYKVMYMDGNVQTFSSERKDVILCTFTNEQKFFRLDIKDENDKSINRMDIKIKDDSDFKDATISYIDDILRRESSCGTSAISEIIDKIKNRTHEGADKYSNKKYGFAVPSKDGYGFLVYTIIIHFSTDKTTYKITDSEYYDYEKESDGFFDGRR